MAAAVVNIKEGVFADAPPICTWIDAMSLAANTAESYTVPAGVDLIRISSDQAIVYYRADGSAAAVTASGGANVVNGTASAAITSPTIRRVDRGQVISFLTVGAGVVYIECFSRHKG